MATKKQVELEHQEARLRDRIKDLEFFISLGLSPDESAKRMAERHRAVDKLRHVQDAIYKERMENVKDE